MKPANELDPVEIISRLRTNLHLCETAEQFPEIREQLLENVLANPNVFNCLIANQYDLRETAQAFPEQRRRLMDYVLENPNVRERLAPSIPALITIKQGFGDGFEQEYALLRQFLTSDPRYSHYVSGGKSTEFSPHTSGSNSTAATQRGMPSNGFFESRGGAASSNDNGDDSEDDEIQFPCKIKR